MEDEEAGGGEARRQRRRRTELDAVGWGAGAEANGEGDEGGAAPKAAGGPDAAAANV